MLTESRGKIKARKRGQKPTNSRFVHPIELFSKQSLEFLKIFKSSLNYNTAKFKNSTISFQVFQD